MSGIYLLRQVAPLRGRLDDRVTDAPPDFMVDLNPIAAELRAPALNVRHCFGRAALAVARWMLAHAVEQVKVRWKDTPYRLQKMSLGFGAGAGKESTEIFPANAIVVKEGLGVVETLDVACRKVRSVAACNELELRRSLAKPFPVREALATSLNDLFANVAVQAVARSLDNRSQMWVQIQLNVPLRHRRCFGLGVGRLVERVGAV